MLCCLGCKKIENNLLSLSRRNVQLPREGEQAVDINTKVIEITVKKVHLSLPLRRPKADKKQAPAIF